MRSSPSLTVIRPLGDFASPDLKMTVLSPACTGGTLHAHRGSGRRWETCEAVIRAWREGAPADEQRELCPLCDIGGRGPLLPETRELSRNDPGDDVVDQATDLLLEAAFSRAFGSTPRQEALALAVAGQDRSELERAIQRYRANVRRDTENIVRALVAGAAAVAESRAQRAALSPADAAQDARWGYGLPVQEREALVLAERGLDPSPSRTAARAATTGQVGPDQEWLSAKQVAAVTGVSSATVRDRALPYYRGKGSGLHGHQDDRARTRWFFRRTVVEAWMQGKTLEQQIDVCGCRAPENAAGAAPRRRKKSSAS